MITQDATTHINFHFDPLCPLAWRTFLWIRETRAVRPIDITWRFFSLEVVNRKEGVTPNCIFRVMDGEAMDFQDNTFDLIVESGALHHLDFQRAVSELRRVVKPSGEILCIEALRHNPFIHLYRMRTMHLRTQWDAEHILGVEHFEMARNYFGEVSAKFFHLFVLAAVPFRKTRIFTPLRQFLTRVDETILRKPIIGKYAWIMIFTLSKPKKV